jgi:hypothetical protein
VILSLSTAVRLLNRLVRSIVSMVLCISFPLCSSFPLNHSK